MPTAKTVILDTETTGLDHATADVLEISIIDGTGKALLDTLVKPVKNTEWKEVQAIHGITPEMIKEANPPTLAELAPQIEKILSEADTLVIYNVDYDLPFLTEAFHQAGITPPRLSIECCMIKYADYRGIPGRHAGGSKWHKLIDAAKYVGHTWEGQAHRALADCQATLSVWNYLQSPQPHLFEASRLPERDKMGFVWHPDMPNAEEADLRPHVVMMGLDPTFTLFEYDEKTEDEHGKYIGAKNLPIILEGKRLAAIWENEEGIATLTVRPIRKEAQDLRMQGFLLDRTTKLMKKRLKKARQQGAVNWWKATPTTLKTLLSKATKEEDWISVANYAAMLDYQEQLQREIVKPDTQA